MISMNAIWDETVAFLRREAALLVPLALATLLVGNVTATLATGNLQRVEAGLGTIFVVLAAALWSIVGQLAIIALVLRPGSSVGEAISLGASRLPKVLLIGLLIGFIVMLAVIPCAVGLVMSGFDPSAPQTMRQLPAWALLYVFVMLGLLVWLGVRLATLNALILDRNPPVIESLRTAFAMTRGLAARLLAVFIIYAIVSLIVGAAARFVFGTLFTLVGAAAGSDFAGAVLTALASGLVTAALSLIATVFLALLYRRLSSGT